ncbi:carbohydrate ABC transporter permease [Actinophytocola oryzae]|uniref:Multiple sugar transport system permease protein/raffinose/stachyose/melibiose transport system permease protein n=1 Tax=Actinophytocola oryzae TaxID=502181 RepID=A0A4R7VAT0_9PSEU|nr:sugar ABC transporter permease [Actinophytocola oryzae]TDV46096.1 multiple sugar transport system permease protein/raffinose/stachyose/melibiose transport system permease protein [Actinophytocola oryzae]
MAGIVRRQRLREALTGYAFVLPAAALFGLMGAYTVGYGLLLSFARWNGFTRDWLWVGVDNYLDILYRDAALAPIVHDAARGTLLVMIGMPVLSVVVGLPIALALNRIRLLRTTLRTVFFLPYVTTGVAVFFAWSYVLAPAGSLNTVLGALGLGSLQQPQGFLGNPSTALPTLVAVMAWSSIPVAILLYLAALQAIDPNVIDAATVDGASNWRVTTSVLWPLLRPTTAAVVLLGLRDALQGFQIFLLMTGGGPGGTTNVLGLQAYKWAFFSDLRPTLGLASALGWVLFVVALLLAAVNLRVLRSRT